MQVGKTTTRPQACNRTKYLTIQCSPISVTDGSKISSKIISVGELSVCEMSVVELSCRRCVRVVGDLFVGEMSRRNVLAPLMTGAPAALMSPHHLRHHVAHVDVSCDWLLSFIVHYMYEG